MTSTTTLRSRAARLLRPLASLALAVALATPLVAAAPAHAQFMRNLPSPVSAQQLEGFIKSAGLSTAARDQLLRLHEAYFERFRAFEEQEIDPSLKTVAPRELSMTRTVDDARREADMRRRALQRAAQIDGQLVDELLGMVGGDDAVRAEKLRTALARRRATSVMPPLGFAGDAVRFDLRTAAVLATIDEATRQALAPSFDAYDAELTRLCERYADDVIARGVKSAQLREEMGLGAPPEAEPGQEGAGDGMQRWFESLQEIQRRAGEAAGETADRIRRLHRDTLAQVEPLLSTRDAMALRTHLASGVYSGTLSKNRFEEAVARLDAKRKSGDIDAARWSAVEDALLAHAPTLRALGDEVMDARDKSRGFGLDDAVVVFPSGAPDSESPEAMRLRDAKRRYDEASDRAADALLAAAGIDAETQPQLATREIDGVGGLAITGGVEIGAVAVMVGGDGEAVVLSGDDLEGQGFITSMDGGSSVPRAMTRDALDALATRIGLDGAGRAAFDGIVEECAAARAAAEADAGSPPEQIELGGEGSMAVRITIGADGEASVGAPDPAKQAALIVAIETAEERMFDALKAAAPAEKAAALESARRMRARERLLTGERGAVGADLVRIAETAALSESARAAIAAQLGAWDEASVPALRAMRTEIDTMARERQELFAQASSETVDTTDDGTTSVNRSVSFSGEATEKMERLGRREVESRDRIVSMTKSSLDTMLEALAGDAAAQKAIRRGYLRAANPSTYRRMRDLEPFFERALRAVGDDTDAKDTVLAIKSELDEAREARCEAFLDERERSKKAAEGGDTMDLGGMQARLRENKRLAEDLGQIEATLFRRLVDFVSATAGAEKAKEIGDLPSNERRQPSIRFGG